MMAASHPTFAIPEGHRGKFAYLCYVQVLFIALFPFLEKGNTPSMLFRVLGAIAFFAAVYAVSEKRAHWVTALALAIPAGVLNAIFAFHSGKDIAVPTLGFTLLFLGYTVVTLLRAALRPQRVTSDTIYGAISVYLLMALLWAVAYLLLVTVQPGALVGAAAHRGQSIDWFDCIFYSFVTLTTTGYGDIVAVTTHARSLSILEAVSGVMYMAVFVARLVGLYSSERAHLKSDIRDS